MCFYLGIADLVSLSQLLDDFMATSMLGCQWGKVFPSLLPYLLFYMLASKYEDSCAHIHANKFMQNFLFNNFHSLLVPLCLTSMSLHLRIICGHAVTVVQGHGNFYHGQ
jgi:hypothetical protein